MIGSSLCRLLLTLAEIGGNSDDSIFNRSTGFLLCDFLHEIEQVRLYLLNFIGLFEPRELDLTIAIGPSHDLELPFLHLHLHFFIQLRLPNHSFDIVDPVFAQLGIFTNSDCHGFL